MLLYVIVMFVYLFLAFFSFVLLFQKLLTISLLLQGLPRQLGAFQILKAVESFYLAGGAACKLDVSSFSVKVISKFHVFYSCYQDRLLLMFLSCNLFHNSQY